MERDVMRDLKDMLQHGLMIAILLAFWAALSQLASLGASAANLSPTVSAYLSNALYTTGMFNAALYVLTVAVRAYRQGP